MIKILGFMSIMMIALAGLPAQAQAMGLLVALGSEESAEVVETALDTQTQPPADIEPAAGESENTGEPKED